MRFSPALLDQIKARINLVDEVRKTVPTLKKKGKYWWGNCPFHNEKSPSFHVREEGNYYCFGCGAGGDIFGFVQETQGGTFPEVVERLAKQAGVALPKPENYDPKAEARRNDGLKALERAVAHFQKCLPHSPGSAYLAKRALSVATIEEFGLGYAPEDWTTLHNALTTEGFSGEVLKEAGLTIASTKGKGDYDRFRGRVMFPIHDASARVVGFGGRILDQGEPKYLNSPETPYFNKGFLLYNLHRAKPALKQGGQLTVVEGYMDVIALYQAGFKTAVAPLGTSITEDHISLLWRHDSAPIVCLDGDAAGKAAAIRAAEKVLPILEPGKTLQFVTLPSGEDPDSLIQKDGLATFRQLLAQPVPLEQVLWQHVLQDADLTTADGRAALQGEVGGLLSRIKNSIVRKAYQQIFKEKAYQATRTASLKPDSPAASRVKARDDKAPADYRPAVQGDAGARYMLALVCRWPEMFPHVVESFTKLDFPKGPMSELAQHLMRAHAIHRLGGEEMKDDLASGPHASTVAELVRSTGVAGLEEDATNPQAEFERVFTGWYHHQHNLELRKATLKDMDWNDPEQWNKFKDLNADGAQVEADTLTLERERPM
ncbi:MAG: DNA primase [Alphaproteobacteria bacterium]